MDESVEKAPGLESLQDYVVVPGQEWLDGTVVRGPGLDWAFVKSRPGPEKAHGLRWPEREFWPIRRLAHFSISRFLITHINNLYLHSQPHF
jgi:hypothetical protein